MKALLVFLFVFTGISYAQAEDVFRIEVGRDYKRYSDSDLRRRVWHLERAVWQLQQRVFDLESSKGSQPKEKTWICTIKSRGETYTGTGTSQALAKHEAMNSCKAGNDGSTFFCKSPTCEN